MTNLYLNPWQSEISVLYTTYLRSNLLLCFPQMRSSCVRLSVASSDVKTVRLIRLSWPWGWHFRPIIEGFPADFLGICGCIDSIEVIAQIIVLIPTIILIGVPFDPMRYIFTNFPKNKKKYTKDEQSSNSFPSLLQYSMVQSYYKIN